MDNWIFKYHEAIQKKEVIVGVWVRLSFEILTTGLLNGEWEFNEKKANKAIKFIENFCHHSEGRSDLLHLELWQKAIVSAIFGVMEMAAALTGKDFAEVGIRFLAFLIFGSAIVISYLLTNFTRLDMRRLVLWVDAAGLTATAVMPEGMSAVVSLYPIFFCSASIGYSKRPTGRL